ncbi:MAG: YihY/virulence factor BrkB family protein [Bacteroidetes bacterium]|nr:MAG: YihY/virulence factor BrkB family protein [Bacteroidota bacterium]
MKKFNLERIKAFWNGIPEWRIVKKLTAWTKEHSIPGFFKIPIYDVFVFVFNEIRRFDLFTRANSIAYSFFISLLPSLLTLFTLLPFVNKYFLRFLPEGESFSQIMQSEIHKVMPGSVGNQLFLFIKDVTEVERVGLLSFGFILAIYFSSNGMLAMMRSFEKSYTKTFKKRTALRKRMVAVALTGMLSFLLIASVVFIILGKSIINWLSEYIALAGFSTIGVDILRWVAIIFLFYFGISVIYRYGAATYRRFSFFSAGATLATVLSLLTSLAFSFYVDDLGRASTYNKFYGSIASIIILMLWIQFNSLIILIGYELNASIAVNRDLKNQIEDEEKIE